MTEQERQMRGGGGPLWESFGFRCNPYDARWLGVNEESAKLFVGREAEARRFFTNLSAATGGMTIVEGDVGVGKTSFVNVQQYLSLTGANALGTRMLPSFETVQPRDPTNTVEILLSALSNAVNAAREVLGSAAAKRDRVIARAQRLTSQLVHESGSFQLGAHVLGTGGTVGLGRATSETRPLAVSLTPLLEAIDEFTERMASHYGYDGAIVPVNNLDVLDDDLIITFFNALRDSAVNRGRVWWVFTGGSGLFSLLEGRASRVSEMIVGMPIVLGPLSWQEIAEAIERRLSLHARGKGVRPPLPMRTARLLYDISKGEIRFIFKRLTDIVLDFKTRFPSECTITYDDSVAILRTLATERLAGLALTKTEMAILAKMAAADEFRPREYAEFGLRSAQSLSKYLRKFVGLQLVHRSRSGRAAVYRPAGDVRLALRADAGKA